jgi:hypothetical protein
LTIKNAGGECLRLRYFAHDNEITGNTIGPCGVQDFKFPSTHKNGEGIYLGTSSNQWTDGKNPTPDPDGSTNNWIHNNTFNTQGNECVDVKEGAYGNIIENNKCTGQSDPNSGGFDSRGDANIFRNNESYGNLGSGVRLGGHKVCFNGADVRNDPSSCPSDYQFIQYGKNNDVYGNSIHDNASGGIKFQVTPQGKICSNTMLNNSGGDSVGTYGSQFNPIVPCSGIKVGDLNGDGKVDILDLSKLLSNWGATGE